MLEYTLKDIHEWTRLGMRKAFGLIMKEIASQYDNIIVLAADIAESANLKEFSDLYPERFFDIGIAEQNMAGVAAGLAKEENNVFIVSFAPFVSMRAYEAIRTLVGYMGLNVKVVALASGMSLGVQGNTHYCLEDISIMRSIPGMMIFSPADCCEMAKCMEFLAGYNGPAYLRLTGIDGTPGVYKENYDFRVNDLDPLKKGEDVAIISTGCITGECIRATRALARENISAGVYNAHLLKEFDIDTLDNISHNYKAIVTVEEHYKMGGLGTIVSDYLARTGKHAPILKIGIEDLFPHAGDYAYLLDKYGLNAVHIKDKILQFYNEI